MKTQVRTSCVLTACQLSPERTNIIVFPEGILPEEIAKAQVSHPESIIVGAIEEDGRSRGLLLDQRRNRINYLKVTTDGLTKGSCNLQQNPVYQFGKVCIGVLICMDVDHPEFSRAVIAKVRSSSAKLKLICIPADMGNHWFSGDILPFPKKFEGTHVILCNHINHQARCKSFITDTDGRKIVVQSEGEPIHTELPVTRIL